MSDNVSGVYVYGLVGDAGVPAPDIAGGAATAAAAATLAPPRLLSCGDLTAIVSTLPFRGDAGLDAVMQDSRQAEALVLHHHAVLGAFVDDQTVVPFRFGTIFHDDGAVAEALDRSRAALMEAMGRVNGALEWGMKVFVARDRLGRRVASEAPAIADLKAALARAGEGTAFILKRRLQRLTEEETERAIGRCLGMVTDRLSRAARECARCRLQPAEMHGRDGEMVLHMACLVSRGAESDLSRLIDDMRADYSGFEFEITGPWPPYNFSDCRLEGDEDAASNTRRTGPGALRPVGSGA